MIYSGKAKEGKLPKTKSATITGPDTVQIDDYDENKGYKIQFVYLNRKGIAYTFNSIKPKEINSNNSDFLVLSSITSLNLKTGEFGYFGTIEKQEEPEINFLYASVEEIVE